MQRSISLNCKKKIYIYIKKKNVAQVYGSGLLETDLDADDAGGGRDRNDDAGVGVVGASGQRDADVYAETDLDDVIRHLERFAEAYRSPSYHAAAAAAAAAASSTGAAAAADASDAADGNKKFKSMLNLGWSSSAPVSVQPDVDMMMTSAMADPSRAKSMEFLLDDDNKHQVQVCPSPTPPALHLFLCVCVCVCVCFVIDSGVVVSRPLFRSRPTSRFLVEIIVT